MLNFYIKKENEISNEDKFEDKSINQISFINIKSSRINIKNSNLRQKRLRYFIKINRINYHKLHIKDFIKIIKKISLINKYNELYIYKNCYDML